jgi:hypothetical protein
MEHVKLTAYSENMCAGGPLYLQVTVAQKKFGKLKK